MSGSDTAPWRDLGGAEGRAARIAAVRKLADEGLDAAAIADRMTVAEWIVKRDLETEETQGAPTDPTQA